MKATQLFIQNKARLTHQLGLIQQFEKFQKETPLPQFLFLGSSNAGKSSLLSQILAPNLKTATKSTNITKTSKPHKPNPSLPDLPFVSKRAGFTNTISVYSLPNRLRIIDTPGYGFKSTEQYGSLVIEYLEKQAQLCKMAYVLVLSTKGIHDLDVHVCELLAEYGVPFTFVLTKFDLIKGVKLRKADYDTAINGIEEVDNFRMECSNVYKLLGVPPAEDILITSTKDNFGVRNVRSNILKLSGL